MNKREKFIYENERGQSIELSVWSPFLLSDISGIEGLNNSIHYSKGLGQDGESYLSSTLDKRDISIQGVIKGNKEINRSYLISVFNPKLEGTLIYDDGKSKKYIKCIVEKAPVISRDNVPKFLLVLVSKSNPFWEDMYSLGEQISTWIGGWKFKFKLPFRFKTKGETRKNIYNSGHVDTPLEVIFKGPATNPSVVNHSTGKFIKVNRNLTSDDTLYINTEIGNKKVEIEKDGNRINAFHYIDLDSTFFNLEVGDNLIEYKYGSMEPQSVEIRYRNRFIGV